jgi:hypothetical protein
MALSSKKFLSLSDMSGMLESEKIRKTCRFWQKWIVSDSDIHDPDGNVLLLDTGVIMMLVAFMLLLMIFCGRTRSITVDEGRFSLEWVELKIMHKVLWLADIFELFFDALLVLKIVDETAMYSTSEILGLLFFPESPR